jgi:acetolactate synthase I/II/III large subunit
VSKQNGAKLLVACLVKHGVQYIFGIPGAKIDSVFDALLDSPIKVIVCRHEQNAAFMAAAYGRLTGTPGVVLVTSGPGVSNLATGLLTATTEGDPMIAIGGNVPRSMKLKESHQSTDNIKLTEAVTKARMEVLAAENIPEVVENAFRLATEPRRGAVFLSFPQDVLLEETLIQAAGPVAQIQRAHAALTVINQIAELINNAKCPALLLGMEASRPENTAAIRQLLQTTPLATVGTYQAAGVVSRELVDCFVGRVGLFKNQPGDKLLDAADVVITVGYDPVEYDPEIWNIAGNKKIIHIDYKPVDIHHAYSPVVEAVGDIAANIKHLIPLLKIKKQITHTQLIKDLQQELQIKIASGAQYTEKLIHPLRFIHDLRQTIDDNAFVISDIGTHYMWLSRYFFSYQPHHLLFSNGQQTLGVALPWAMATHFVHPNSKIISISGDGGFLFSAMELETAVREKINFIHCVWCDGTYNMVQEQQLMKYKRDSAVHFGSVDIVKFAESFGAQGFRVNHSNELAPLLKQALTLSGPVLIEIPIDYSDNAELFKTVEPNIGH